MALMCYIGIRVRLVTNDKQAESMINLSETSGLHGLMKEALGSNKTESMRPYLEHGRTNLGWAICDDRTCFFQSCDLVLSATYETFRIQFNLYVDKPTLSTGDDSAGVTHASAWGCSAASNESYDGLWMCTSLVVFLKVFCSFFFHGSTNLSN